MEFLTALAKESGVTPPTLLQRQLLTGEEEEYYNSFQLLSVGRAWDGQSPRAIPIVEILAFAELLTIRDPDLRNDLLLVIRSLDAKWLDIVRKLVEANRLKQEMKVKSQMRSKGHGRSR